jgi:co-chaperonin GroES (HSP10)
LTVQGHKREKAVPPPSQAAHSPLPGDRQLLFKPTQDYIFVLPVERHQSDVLQVITNEKYTQGTVLAVGPGKKNKKGVIHPLTVKPGDFITYGDLNRGYDFYPKFKQGGVTYRILQEADVCFIAEPDAPEQAFPASLTIYASATNSPRTTSCSWPSWRRRARGVTAAHGAHAAGVGQVDLRERLCSRLGSWAATSR